MISVFNCWILLQCLWERINTVFHVSEIILKSGTSKWKDLIITGNHDQQENNMINNSYSIITWAEFDNITACQQGLAGVLPKISTAEIILTIQTGYPVCVVGNLTGRSNSNKTTSFGVEKGWNYLLNGKIYVCLWLRALGWFRREVF